MSAHRLLFALSIVLLAAGAEAGESALAFDLRQTYRIVVPFESVLRVAGADALAEPCGATDTIHACTVFYARRLDCACFPDEDHWHIHARAQFIPRIVVTPFAELEHERMHIGEVRSSLADYLDTLTAIEFRSVPDCERAAHDAASAFPSVMNEFQRSSNLKHHPMYAHRLEAAQ